ncbi:MAG: prenyltransferase/squalene oxidase repeat-containing protein, partial [Actinomadura sp.]
MAPVIDTRALRERLDESLDLLRDTFTVDPHGSGGGWYHELGAPEPGATATALGLMAFAGARAPFAHFDDGLAFLTARQLRHRSPLVDGGWATKTSMKQPVVEATAWVARFLAVSRCDLTDGAPDVRRAYDWLTANQNADGGWGSMHGCASRVWPTCLALRALVQLDPHAPEVGRGVEWLLAHRVRAGTVWAEVPGGRPEVTHTAFALRTLTEARPGLTADRLVDAYDWLEHELTNAGRGERYAQIEYYTVEHSAQRSSWRLTLWHYGLPLALSALLHHPRGAPGAVICDAFGTLVRSGVRDAPWRELTNDTTSLWSVWWCVEALSDIMRFPAAGLGDTLEWRPDSVVVHRAEARPQPPARRRLRRLAGRHWAGL